jgi:hypothetical protein
MFPSDPRDALVLAHGRAHRLREEAAAEHLHLRGASAARRALAASLRRAAHQLDPAPLAHRLA